MATIPLWAIGKHITAVTLTPLTVNPTTGALTEVTASNVSLYGHFENISLKLGSTMENISAHNRPIENNVLIESNLQYEITELEKSGGVNLLAAAYNLEISSTPIYHWKFTLTRGGQSFTGYGIMSDYTFNGPKNKLTGTAMLKTIDPGSGTANPAYA